MHKKIIESISKTTQDNFIILSTHDDIDILVDGYYKHKIINIFNNLGFTSSVKKPESKCLYYAEHDVQFFKEKFHYDLHSNL